jgi:hypothetical protein
MVMSATTYKKGCSSWNKGKKQRPDSIRKMIATKKLTQKTKVEEHNNVVLDQIKIYKMESL